MPESAKPLSTNVVPNYQSFVMLRINEIAEAINYGKIIQALEMLKTFYITLPTPIKDKLEMEFLKIEVATELASEKRGITAYQTMQLINRSCKFIGKSYVMPFLDDIMQELYTRGYIEKDYINPRHRGEAHLE